MDPKPFEIIAPRGPKRPVVVEIPHAGLALDSQSMVWSIAPVCSIVKDADLYVDRLYQDAPELGATVISSSMSRYVCDLNRSERDIDKLSVQGGLGEGTPHGLVWRRTADGDFALSGPLPTAEYERRRDCYYRPYHEALRRLLDSLRNEFGYVILLCAHSMPSRGKAGTPDAGRIRADLVPGTRGKTTAGAPVIDVAERLASRFGWSLRHDYPYRGGFTTGHYGRPAQGLHAIQLELSRALYMDEQTLVPHTRSAETRSFCAEVVMSLGRLNIE
jgi:N-formylglutamate amidohydrolase